MSKPQETLGCDWVLPQDIGPSDPQGDPKTQKTPPPSSAMTSGATGDGFLTDQVATAIFVAGPTF